MYTILGSEGKQYGPIDVSAVQTWFTDGRINRETMVQTSESDDWKKLSEIPELVAALGLDKLAPSLPPVVPTPALPKRSGVALAALILGICSLLCNFATGLPGLICGIIGLVKINKSNGQLTGRAMAIWGIVLSVALPLILTVAFLFPAIRSAQDRAETAKCMNNLRQMGVAVSSYLSDHSGNYPGGRWCDDLMPYCGMHSPDSMAKSFHCLANKNGQAWSYAFNANLVGKNITDIVSPGTTVLAVDYPTGWNGTIPGAAMSGKPPHSNGWNILYVDGHVERVSESRIQFLQWKVESSKR